MKRHNNTKPLMGGERRVKFTGASSIFCGILACLGIYINLHQQVLKRYNNSTATIASSLESSLPPPPTRNKISQILPSLSGVDVIVYLAQFGHHSSYGNQTDGKNPINGLSKLNRSLELLYSNYLDSFPSDVIVFYGEDETPPSKELIHDLQYKRPRLKFHQLNGTWWSLPHGLRAQDRGTWRQSGYSIGYRHMCQWYAVRIWPFLANLGYTHVMRMDDDSYIYSTITYNMFDYMRQHNKRYAFRQPVVERNVGNGFFELVNEFIEGRKQFLESYVGISAYQSNRELGFYNNFFIAEIDFFMSPPASLLLDDIDKSKKIYEQRTNDLIIQSVLVRIFLPPEEVLWIRDFTYEHTTLVGGNWPQKGCLQNGGISRGVGAHSDEEWRQIQDSYQGRFLHNPNCLSKKAVRNAWHVGAGDIAACEDPKGFCAKGLQLSTTTKPTDWDSSLVNIMAACKVTIPDDERLLLLTDVQGEHGSTATTSLLMSNSNISTLCANREFQCEGFQTAMQTVCKNIEGTRYCLRYDGGGLGGNKLLDLPDSEFLDPTKYNILDLHSASWNLDRPVLQDKLFPEMPGYTRLVEVAYSAGLPSRMSDHGIRSLKVAHVFIWTPLCVMPLHTSVNKRLMKGQRSQWTDEVWGLEKMRQSHSSMIEGGTPALVVSYADLMFDEKRVLQRINDFLPCAGGGVNSAFVPKLGVDIWEGNHWKVRGDVQSFAKTKDPSKCCGYDPRERMCKNRSLYEMMPEYGDKIKDLEAYFWDYS